MTIDTAAVADEADSLSEADYDAFCTALEQSARGRAFLAEYARRARSTESEMLMTAVRRLEAQIAVNAVPAADAGSAGRELRGLLDTIRALQAEIDAAQLAMQVAKLGSLIEVVQQKLAGLVMPAPEPAPRGAEADDTPPPVAPRGAEAAAQAVGVPEIYWYDNPSAAGAAPQVIAPARETPPPSEPAAPVTVLKAGTIPPPTPFTGEDFAGTDAPPAESGPLADIMAMSEEERLALFT